MKLLIACLATETNTFSPMPTGRLAFEASMVSREATRQPAMLFSAPLHEWRRMAEEKGWEVIESLTAAAQPAGPTVRAVYEGFRDEILADIERHQPDVLLMSMHGAMVADGYDDCEGDMMARARAIMGPDKVIGLELDPHNHLTQTMLDNATLIINFKEYPHVDAPERARELFVMAADAAEGKTKPVMRAQDCRMLTIIETMKEPAKTYVQAMKDAEGKDGILSVSLTHGFPWADVADVGAKTLVIADGDADKAARVAKEFADKLWNIRDGLRMNYPDISAALDIVSAANHGPIALADMGDNAGGGAPADSTFFLQEILRRGMKDIAHGIFWDPVLVTMCQDAGVGARLRVRLGGKICKESGDAVDLDVTVRAIRENMTQKLGETDMPMGTGVWLDADGVHLIVSSLRTQNFSPSVYTDLGIDITQMRALIPKSTNHFYQNFERISPQVVHVRTPGTVTPDMTIIPFTKRDGNFWPKVENPFN
ncbi:M81 family metallopeptidase [Ruegeria sp. 1NDH52C]|uniref:Microcystinase C n=1 Tax=Ruegeria alba TaxID=2916756 RepID=A0ABS9P2D0_9RHOB|nr:M81 family metallopeptidase [Ruegeria pomeroyi]MCE8553415.1 M81 family metallopeptidase [Ruegeria pomeroyi]MCG6560626.1 M81 family metallopeptidase [Ruegeria alba]